jgi:hypothetical protein
MLRVTPKTQCVILKSHGGHFVNFYGRFAAEGLEP